MLIKSFKLNALTLAGVAMIVAALLAAPTCYAGGAATLVPADDRIAPDGSYISEERKKKIDEDVKAYKAKRKEAAERQQQVQSDQSQTSESDAPEEK